MNNEQLLYQLEICKEEIGKLIQIVKKHDFTIAEGEIVNETSALDISRNDRLPKANCYYTDNTKRSIQVFSYKIWIDDSSKSIYNEAERIFRLDDEEDEFIKLEFGHLCIIGVTKKRTYKVYQNNGITLFNRENRTSPFTWD